MHEFKNPIVKDSWVSTVCTFSLNWKLVEGYRKKLILIFGEHVKNRDGLSLQDCESLSISVGLDTGRIRRKWHDKEKRMNEAFYAVALRKSLPKKRQRRR